MITLNRRLLHRCSTTVSFSASDLTARPCIADATISNTDLPSNETWILLISEHLPHPRQCTRPEAGGITLPSAMELLPQEYRGKTKQRGDLEMEIGRVIWHTQSVYQGRLSISKDIRRLILPFINFAISHSSHFSHGSTVISYLVKSHSLLHTISLFSFVLWYLLSIIVVRTNTSFVS